MEISRDEGIAVWRQIANAVERDIETGSLKPGDRLPTEQALAGRYGVNRHTVRRAVSVLQDSGLVNVQQGRGTFVHKNVLDYVVGKRTRFTESLDRDAYEPTRTLQRTGRMAAGRAIAAALGITARAEVEMIETVGHADGRPLSLATHYFASKQFAGIAQAWQELGSISASLARFGINDYVRRSTRVIARPPDADERQLLELPRHRPVLVTESVNTDLEGNPVEFGLTRFAADRIQLVFDS